MRSILGTALGLAIVLGCVGCGAASQKILGQPVHRQVAIMVRISRQVDLADNAGGVAELVEAIEKGLKDEGLNSEVYGRGRSPTTAAHRAERAVLERTEFHVGSAPQRGFTDSSTRPVESHLKDARELRSKLPQPVRY